MMKFSQYVLRNFELNNKPTLMFFTYGCNLACTDCCNKELLSPPNNTNEYVYKEEIYSYIKLSEDTYNNIVFTGGEFLANNTNELEVFLERVNNIYDGKIFIYTNGSYPTKIEKFRHLVDGYLCDYKLPFHMLDLSRDNFIVKKILGKPITEYQRQCFIKSIDYLSKNKSPYDAVRTVKHPSLSDKALNDIKIYIESKDLKYCQNEFCNLND